MVTPQSLPSEDDEDRLPACLPASHACHELAACTASIHGGLVALPLEHLAFSDPSLAAPSSHEPSGCQH